MRKRAILAALFLLMCGCTPEAGGKTGETSREAETARTESVPETVFATGTAETEADSGPETKGEVYTAKGKGAVGKITVTLVVSDGQIADCIIDASEESPDKGGVVAEKFREEFLNGTPVDELDAVSGASVSSATIKQLLRKCLEEAGITQ